MGSKGSATTKQSYSLPPEFQAAYKKSIDMATAATSQPYQAYQGQLVAGLNPTQLQGISNVNAAQGMALPAIGRGMQLTERAAQGITPELYNQFYSPYVRDVADTTFANMMESAAQQRSGLKGGAIQAGAFGGDRAGIAAAEMARQQQLGLGQTMSGIYNQGYGQAMQLAGQQAQNYGAMGQQLAGLGVGAQGSVLQGAQAQLAAGAQQQATDQAQLQAAYEQWMQRQAYPYQQAQFFANIAQGLGAGAGGTSSTTTPGPSLGSQILGGIGAVGSIFSGSDERMKENIEAVGTLNDGQTIYRYNFKGDPKTQIGLLAQEVETRKPDAVAEVSGLKMVNYKDATDQAASMGGLVTPDMQGQGFAEGGGVPYHPYESRGYVPEGKIGRGGRGIPEAPDAFKDEGLSKDWKEMMPLTKEQVGGLKALADKLGIVFDRPEKSALGLIGPSEYDVNAPKFEDVYPDKEYYTGFASGGVVGRNGYLMGGEPTMEDAMNEAGLAAAEEPEAPSRLLQRESGGDFGASNEYGASGRAQFMPARMIDLKRAGVVPPEMTPEEFRDNPEVQKAAEKWHFNDLNEFIDRNGLAAYEGKVINGVPVTREGMVNVAHLGGPGGLVAYLKSGGRDDRKDPYGTKLSDYMAMGAEQPGVAGATVQPMADTEAVMPEEPRSRFDLNKLIASEDNPSIIESIMGRRLSPEARAAVMNASFAMLAGRSPFMGVNIGEAGKVGMQTYYNALQQNRELAKQQADISRQGYEAQTGRMSAVQPLVAALQDVNRRIAIWAANPQNSGKPIPDYFVRQLELLEKAGLGTTVSGATGLPVNGGPAVAVPEVSNAEPIEETTAPVPVPAVSQEGGEEAAQTGGGTIPAPAEVIKNPQSTEAKNFFDELYGPSSNQNPFYLERYADNLASLGETDQAKYYRDQATAIRQRIMENGVVMTPQGVTINAPGVVESQTEIERAKKAASTDQEFVTDMYKTFSLEPQKTYATTRQNLEKATQILENFETGSLAGLKANIAGVMDAINIPVSQEQLNSAADYQEFVKLITGNLLNSGLRQNLGQVALGELQIAQQTVASAENQPSANRAIIGVQLGVLDWQNDRGKAIRRFIQDNGGTGKVNPIALQDFIQEWDGKLSSYVEDTLANTPVKGEINFDDPKSRKKAKPGWKYIMRNGDVAVYDGEKFIGVE